MMISNNALTTFALCNPEETMNKYQNYILNKIGSKFIYALYFPISSNSADYSSDYGSFDGASNSFNIKQDEDITKTRYAIVINTDKLNPLDSVSAQKNDQWLEIPFENNQYVIITDFNDRINTIRFSFIDKIADDYILKVTYTEADKEHYYAKLEQTKRRNLLATAAVKSSTGADLVNIYFQPCCNEYDHSEIKLFVPKTTMDQSTETPSDWYIIKNYNVSTGDFYKSISGLAYGKYAFVLSQYNKNNQLLLETDYMMFSIDKPAFSVYRTPFM